EQVENHVLHMTYAIFDVVAEDPEEKHVAADVREVAVHEHRGEERQINRTVGWSKTGNHYAFAHVLDNLWIGDDIVASENLERHSRVGVSELVVAPEALQNDKDKNVESDNRVVDYRRY